MAARGGGPRYKAQPQTIQRELQKTLTRMRATGLKVTQDFETGEVEIRFDRMGRRYVFRCRKWSNQNDNFRAAQRAITLLYQAVEEAGVTSSEQALGEAFEQFFAGWAATPDDSVLMLPSGTRDWWDVLGVRREATASEIRNAYLALARIHHPDNGGSADDFKRVRAAYEAGIAPTGG